MARLLFLPDDRNLLLLDIPGPAETLLKQVQNGLWQPPAPYDVYLQSSHCSLQCVMCGNLVIVQVERSMPVETLEAIDQMRLPERDRLILQYLSDGLKTREIAARMGISSRTVSSHLASLKARFGVRTVAQTVGRAAALGLVRMKRRG